MKGLLPLLKRYKTESIMAPLFKLLEAAFELTVPLIIARLIDIGIAEGNKHYIAGCFAMLISFAVIGFLCTTAAQFFAAKAAVGISSELRHNLMERIQSLSYSRIDNLGTSELITNMTSDVAQVQNGVNLLLRLLLRSPFIVFGAMIMAFTIDWQSATVFAVAVPLLFAVCFAIMLYTIPRYERIQKRLDGLTETTRENLSGVRTIRAFGIEKNESNEFKARTSLLLKLQQYVGGISAMHGPITFLIINAGIILLIWTGAIRVDGGMLTRGQVIALYNYMSQILVELIKFTNLIITMTRSVASANRLQTTLATESDQTWGTLNPIRQGGTVQFCNVSLTYADAGGETLHNISFYANAGEVIGIIGSSGSGKTSVVNLLPRFYDASKGSILIDNTDVRHFAKKALRERIGFVGQSSVLFKGTIRENLLWGNPDASDEAILDALAEAQALDFVREKPLQLDYLIEQGGKNLSGGQRQRLTIARALVRKPEILILDDSSSALDYATEAKLRTAIKNSDSHPTTFIVSQRIASLVHADRILVFDDGRVVGEGVHEELLTTCKVYYEIYKSQQKNGGEVNAG